VFLVFSLPPERRVNRSRQLSGTPLCHVAIDELLPTEWVRRQDDRRVITEGN